MGRLQNFPLIKVARSEQLHPNPPILGWYFPGAHQMHRCGDCWQDDQPARRYACPLSLLSCVVSVLLRCFSTEHFSNYLVILDVLTITFLSSFDGPEFIVLNPHCQNTLKTPIYKNAKDWKFPFAISDEDEWYIRVYTCV